MSFRQSKQKKDILLKEVSMISKSRKILSSVTHFFRTKSFLYKYSNIGNTKTQYNSIHKRNKDICTQTSDKEDISDYELSAMEKDIFQCTGCMPGKLKKLKKTQI